MKSQRLRVFPPAFGWLVIGPLLPTLMLGSSTITQAQEKQTPANRGDNAGGPPRNPALRGELLQMRKVDQEVRTRISADLKDSKNPEPELAAELKAADAKNTARMEQIIYTGAKKAPEKAGEIKLFNGKDFTGWTFYLRDPNAKMEDVWSIDPKEGIIICKGKPNGYIRTVADYTNYILKLEWRFNPGTKQAGNSGVLLRIVGPDKVWPKSVEAQLQSGAAGDFWLIDGARLDTPEERVDKKTPRHRLRTKTNEKPIGEWNEYEITCDGDKITLKVNGEVLNEGTNAEVVPGKIGLQSEGAEIHFRNIRLVPLQRGKS